MQLCLTATRFRCVILLQINPYYNISPYITILKAQYDLNCIESAVKLQPTNLHFTFVSSQVTPMPFY